VQATRACGVYLSKANGECRGGGRFDPQAFDGWFSGSALWLGGFFWAHHPGDQSFLMRRAKGLFERQGLVVQPFPVDFQARGRWPGPVWSNPTQWLLSARALDDSSREFRELLGRVVYRLVRSDFLALALLTRGDGRCGHHLGCCQTTCKGLQLVQSLLKAFQLIGQLRVFGFNVVQF